MIELNKVYNENCIHTMSRIPDDSIDMVLCSPPYDETIVYDGEQEWNFDIFKDIASNIFPILKSGGVLVWVVGDQTVDGSETGTSFKQALFFKELGLKLHDTMIYEKSGFSNPSRNRYHQTFEYMFVFSKGSPKTFNPIKDRKNKYTGICGGEKSFRDEYGMRFNVWRYANGGNQTSKDKNVFKHPAPFPEKLAEDHITTWSNPQDIIYDPFMGVATTAKMCIKTGRNYIGSEISEVYYKLCEERLKL